MVLVVVLTLAAFGLWIMRRSAQGFAERQRRLGRWDDQGPLVEPYSPGQGMLERREVIGQYHGRVLKDRRPVSQSHSDPQGTEALGSLTRDRHSADPFPKSTPRPNDDY